MYDVPVAELDTTLNPHEVLLQATAQASERLLDDDAFEDGLLDAFRLIGDATRVDRMYLFENRVDPETGMLLTSQRYEWARDQVAPQIDNPELQDVGYERDGYGRWRAVLERGEVLSGPVRTFPSEERERLEAQDIISLLVVPVLLDGTFWGFVGFDDCQRERDWSESERAALTMAACLIARALLRRRDRQALQASEERYENLIRSVRDVVFQTDADGRWTFLNPAWTRLTGYVPEETLGQSLLDYLHPEERTAGWDGFLPAILNEQRAGGVEVRCRTCGGGYRWVVIQARQMRDEGGRLLGVSGTLHDVTERHRAMAAAASALERERELGELKSRFIATASHELRTPLTAIASSADLLEQRAPMLSDERRAKLFQRIQQNVAYMTGLLEDVLLLSEADSGIMRFDPEPVDVRAFCKNLVRAVRHGVGLQHDLQLVADDTPLVADVDSGLLRLALTNLLVNACRYTPEHTRVEVALRSEAKTVVVVVRDEGAGIPEEDLPRLFQPFHRGSNVDAKDGAGLGLTIVQRAVHLHGGRVQVESRRGEGTTVTMTLPQHQVSVGQPLAVDVVAA